uniref:Uncharacterized protein n=1 Tax=Oryzias latipes TaxID=8090 RepID=A0A3P9JZ05_ORYLA
MDTGEDHKSLKREGSAHCLVGLDDPTPNGKVPRIAQGLKVLKPPILIGPSSHIISAFADDILIYLTNIDQSITSLLSLFVEFKQHSGYKINWTKSVLMPLNEEAQNISISSPILLSRTMEYLGIQITTSLQNIVEDNYTKTFKEIVNDLNIWTKFPSSLQTRISVIKMNVLPRINFLSMMIPISPSADFWGKIHREVRLEKRITYPRRLEDILFSGVKINYCKTHFGPIISNMIITSDW